MTACLGYLRKKHELKKIVIHIRLLDFHRFLRHHMEIFFQFPENVISNEKNRDSEILKLLQKI